MPAARGALRSCPRRPFATIILAVGAALCVTGSAHAWQRGATPVGVGEVMSEQVQSQQMVTGELRAVRRSRVASEEAGVVAALHVLEGQQVKEGEELAVLDYTRLEIELAQAESDLNVAKALVEEREADLAKARDDAEALRAIFEQRAANAKELRDAEADLRIAEARIEWAKLSVEVAEAQRDLVEKRLRDTRILAPYDGVVVARHVEVGEWLAEGDPVVDLISTGTIEAWLSVPQNLYVDAGKDDLEVAVRIEATGEVNQSQSKRVIPLVDPRARSFMLVVTLLNEDRTLASGMSVVGWVPTGESQERMTVHSDAIMRNDTGEFVYVVRAGAEGAAQAMPVTVRVLHPVGPRMVIESQQLATGDKVVTEGNERLYPMAPVQPIERAELSRRDGAQGALE